MNGGVVLVAEVAAGASRSCAARSLVGGGGGVAGRRFATEVLAAPLGEVRRPRPNSGWRAARPAEPAADAGGRPNWRLRRLLGVARQLVREGDQVDTRDRCEFQLGAANEALPGRRAGPLPSCVRRYGGPSAGGLRSGHSRSRQACVSARPTPRPRRAGSAASILMPASASRDSSE